MTAAAPFVQEFLNTYAKHPHYTAPRGSTLHALSWETEAPLRLLLNNLDSDVAEDPSHLIVYGGIGQAARSVGALQQIIGCLLRLKGNESLLIQSGKAVAILPTHPAAPRVLIANSNLVPAWATWEKFYELQERGLIMYGQMTAGSWIYIGTQGIVQGTYETFGAVARQHTGGTLKHRLIVSGGLGGMGGAQPLAATLHGGTFLGVDVDPGRIQKRLDTHYLDIMETSYERAIALALQAKQSGKALSIGLVGDIGTILERLYRDDIIPDVLTDQTSAHDPINGYIPRGYTLEAARELRKRDPERYRSEALSSMAAHVKAMLEFQHKGSIVFDYGNNLRAFAKQGGESRAFDIPGFVPAYIRPLFCQGKGPFRWVALSGDKGDIEVTDQVLIDLFPEDRSLHTWLKAASRHVDFQGLPARICWLDVSQRAKAGLAFNKLVAERKVQAPIAIGRDHLDCGSVASPYRETEQMLDGSDAISDWPLLNALVNCASGATWVSFHHGGGVGMGFSQHAGMVIVADGTPKANESLARVLFNDPALGVIRHSDAGYEIALRCAKEQGLILPLGTCE